MSALFGILSGLMGLLIYALYYRQVRRGASTPNLTTWFIWVLVCWLNLATYVELARNDLFKGSMAVVSAGCMTLLFATFVRGGRFTRFGLTDMLILILALAVMVFWQISDNAVWANLALQVCFVLSFIPTLRGLIHDQAREAPMPWLLGVVTYLLNITAIALGTDPRPAEFAFPVINGVLGNGSVLVVTLAFRRYASWL